MAGGGIHNGLVFAVLGSPDSDWIIDAPDTREGMNQLRAEADRAGQSLWCSLAVGGCGSRLMTVNGVERRPHFRHYAGADCQLRDTPETRDTFTHRAIQTDLVRWLNGLGHPARIEHRLDQRSRVDVYSAGRVIEVQLSAETEHSRIQRTARYGGNVTWLFGPHNGITSRDAQLEADGVVLLVRLAEREPGTSLLTTRPVQIGLRETGTPGHPHTGALWASLESCQFDPDAGLQHPGEGEARRRIAEARRIQREKEEAERAAAEAERAEARARAEENRRRAALAAREEWSGRPYGGGTRTPRQTEPPRPDQDQLAERLAALAQTNATRPGPRPTVLSWADLDGWEARHRVISDQLRHVIRYCGAQYNASYPETVCQADGSWATGLPEHLIDPAWAAWYRTGVILAGRVSLLADREVDPDGLIVGRLVRVGRITVTMKNGYAMYSAARG